MSLLRGNDRNVDKFRKSTLPLQLLMVITYLVVYTKPIVYHMDYMKRKFKIY